VTSRPLHDGVGLIAYLALAHEQGQPPRVTAYISSEAYTVRPPSAAQVPQFPVPSHRTARAGNGQPLTEQQNTEGQEQ
jgi:hypothetical protein